MAGNVKHGIVEMSEILSKRMRARYSRCRISRRRVLKKLENASEIQSRIPLCYVGHQPEETDYSRFWTKSSRPGFLTWSNTII